MIFFLQEQYSIAVFLAVVLLISLSNLYAISRLGARSARGSVDSSLQGELPRVSVLVPSRNEELNIAKCVGSLLAQDYPDFEVVIVDDSEDDTWDILRAFTEDRRFRLLRGEPLPPGWLGKHWACEQLAQAATGEVLLFTDADTYHRPLMLREAVEALLAGGYDFLSAIPRHELRTWGERLILPVLPFSLHTFFPIALACRVRLPVLSTAVGQFMLFQKEAYLAIGGHERVRRSIVDDVSLAQETAKAGLSWSLTDGSRSFSVRMYRTFREVWDGLSKNLFAIFGHNLPLFCFVWLWLFLVAWDPPIVLILWATQALPVPGQFVLPAALAIGLGLLLWLVPVLRFRLPLVQVVLHPITMLLMLPIAARSIIWHATGRGTWKGRPLWPSDHSDAA